MGLGPPVCVPCRRVHRLRSEKPPGQWRWWWCPACGSEETDTHLHELPTDQQEEFRHNSP